jgi:hypothetical protein
MKSKYMPWRLAVHVLVCIREADKVGCRSMYGTSLAVLLLENPAIELPLGAPRKLGHTTD